MGKKADSNKEVLNYIIWALIGAAVMTVLLVLIEIRQPREINKCNDGWSMQVEDGVIYKTYIPENDTCTKEQ